MIEQQKARPMAKSHKGLPEQFARDPILSTAQIAKIVGTSSVHLRRLVKTGKFPPPIKIGYRKLGWRLSTIESYISECERVANVKLNPKFGDQITKFSSEFPRD